jgi:hypothetical protein
MDQRRFGRARRRKRKIVVFGGTGAIGANIVERAGLEGYTDIVAVGRKPLEGLSKYMRQMFNAFGVEYIGGIDLSQSRSKPRITKMMADAHWTFYAAGGYPLEPSQLDRETEMFRRFAAAAKMAGYSEGNDDGKSLVAADSPLRIRNHPGADREDIGIPSDYGIEAEIPYLEFKVKSVAMLRGLAYRLVAPTNVVSAWGDHGFDLEALPIYFNHPEYKWALDRRFDTVSGADVGKAFLAVARNGRNGEVYQAVGVPMSPADLIEMGLRIAGGARWLGRSDVSDSALIAAINNPAGARRSVETLRLFAQLWTFGLLDPVGRVPDAAYNPLFSVLALMMGEERDGSKLARLGVKRSSEASVSRELKRQVMYLASKGRLPGSPLEDTTYADFRGITPSVRVRAGRATR